MVVTDTHAKDQGQRSVGLKDRVEMEGQTDGCDCITPVLMRSVIKLCKLAEICKKIVQTCSIAASHVAACGGVTSYGQSHPFCCTKCNK